MSLRLIYQNLQHDFSLIFQTTGSNLRKMVAVLMVLTSHEDMGNTGKKTGWYLPELAHPYHVFKTAGYNMTFVSPKGGKAPLVSIMPFSYFSGYCIYSLIRRTRL